MFAEISDHHVQQFVDFNEKLIALEGLAHMMPKGSLIDVQKVDGKWTTNAVAELHDEPTVGLILRDGRVLISLVNCGGYLQKSQVEINQTLCYITFNLGIRYVACRAEI